METRPHDNSTHGLKDWTLTSVHQWGEAGNGVWTVKVGAKVMPDTLDLVKDKLKHSSSHLGGMRYGQHRQSHLDGSKEYNRQFGSDPQVNMDDLDKYGSMRLNGQGHDQQLGSDPEVNMDDLKKYGNMRLNSQGHDQELGSDPEVNMNDLEKYGSTRLNSQGPDQELGSDPEVNMDDLEKYGSTRLNSQGHDQELGSDPEVNMDDLQPKYGREHLTRKGHDQQLGSDLEVNMDDLQPKYRREHLTRKGHDQQLGSNLEVNMNDLDKKYRSMYFNGHDNEDINLEKDLVDLGFDLDISEGDVNGPPRPRGQNFRYGHLRRLERSQQHDDHIDYGKVNLFEHQGQVDSVKILLHGTREMPDHYKNGRRGYSTYRHQRDEDGANEKRERVKRRF
ncbi:hypothetical protein LSTR_LSTR013893 [Laodelphax striatellus]|uniref:P/Homo B domain-containing protein n=1 Tax=Laodelphax striatellus TaxID=195883 RepID=A0A482X6K9_LAOST|nr:hypothetical protein LSTR_LSTR013893 [Laodelphax striatellus]